MESLVENFFMSAGFKADCSCQTSLVRGLRTDTDFKSEEIQLRFMQDMNPDIRVIFIAADKTCEHVASSFIRSISKYDIDQAARYLVSGAKAYSLVGELEPDAIELVSPMNSYQEIALQTAITEILLSSYQRRLLLDNLRKQLLKLFRGDQQISAMSDRRLKERLLALDRVILAETPEGTMAELSSSK